MTTARDYLESALKCLREAFEDVKRVDNGRLILATTASRIADADSEIRAAARVLGIELENQQPKAIR